MQGKDDLHDGKNHNQQNRCHQGELDNSTAGVITNTPTAIHERVTIQRRY